ncbi:MAG: DEAD/DEAH box helicase, partial [Chloroflexi bacterium]|nr:DEAD/DEAH box helicase [Chloroflexota bacterium]
MLTQLPSSELHKSCITAIQSLPSRAGAYAGFPPDLDRHLRAALWQRGIAQLYTHQRSAFDLVQQGKHVAVVAPTASGKSLCYHLPVIDCILKEPTARALYLYPTKALAQDQLADLQTLTAGLNQEIKVYTYDGDTPPAARHAIRRAGQIVITNPDMLHTAILPHHTKWLQLFENLRYVVIDELHTYRGVFGSHTANVFRRLKRICRYYGSSPQFICTSATIANPAELASRLTEEEFALVAESGAPSGEKHIIFYNPPVVNRSLGLRRSALMTAKGLGEELLANDVQTILFARSRLAVEVLLTHMKEAARAHHRPEESVRGYRGGYLPLERRAIERGLRDGQVRAVVSTNALELGIDIGSLDASILVGYPGSIASAWQQMGRAGRRADVAVAIYVATSSPLDQYLVTHPDYFFEQSPE